MDTVTIIVPTLNRPEPLRRAIASLLRQTGAGDVSIDIVVIDNSRDGNARVIVEAFALRCDHMLRWFSEPNAGVANARNLGLRVATGRYIAFLDDDEEADPLWIAALVAVARNRRADAVFGPVTALAEEGAQIGAFAPYFSRQINSPEGGDITSLVAQLGTNNSLFDRQACFASGLAFDPRLNTSGGEDSLVLMQLVRAGKRFAYAPGASVREWVPARRLAWAYVRRRKFLSGQIRVFVLHMLKPPNWFGIARWMMLGGCQTVVGAVLALVLLPFDRQMANRAWVSCHAGLGKLFWMARFRPALYGTGLVS